MPRGGFLALKVPAIKLAGVAALVALLFGAWQYLGGSQKTVLTRDIQQAFKDNMAGIESYHASFTTALPGDKGNNIYKVEIWKGAPGLYRMEMVELDEQGKQVDSHIVLTDGEECYLYNTELGDFYPVHDLGVYDTPYLILEDYWSSLAQAREFNVLSEEKGARHSYYLVEIYPSEPHLERVRELAWIETESLLPVRLELYDAFGLNTQVTFFEIIRVNPNIEASLFQVYRE